jgi:hypothetical protein
MQVRRQFRVSGPSCSEIERLANMGHKAGCKLDIEINRKYLPLTGIEPGHLALKSINLYKQ